MPQTDSRTRREFLRDSLAAAAAVSAMTTTNYAQSATPASRPAWTIACRDAHLGETGEPDAWAAMSAIGVDGAEVTVTLTGDCPGLFGLKKPASIAKPDGVKALADLLNQNRKKISAFCLHNNFDGNLEPEIECVKMTARAARELGVPAVRLDVQPRKIKDQDEFLKFAIQTGKRIIEVTADTNVRFGVENHGGTTNRPEFLKPFFEGVGSKRFGLTLDTANFYWFGHPLSELYGIYRTFAPNVCHTHCKSIKYPEPERDKQRPIRWEYGKYCCPIYEGDIDFKRVVRILRRAGYQGALCIENESLGRFPKEQRKEILRKEADFLRNLVQT
jgi:sugar phosphate isomerase/epimerase